MFPISNDFHVPKDNLSKMKTMLLQNQRELVLSKIMVVFENQNNIFYQSFRKVVASTIFDDIYRNAIQYYFKSNRI